MFILNDHAGTTLYAVLAARPISAPEDVCVNEVSLVELADETIYIYDEHDNVVLTIACDNAADARAYVKAMKLAQAW